MLSTLTFIELDKASSLTNVDVVVDAVFGTGLTRDVEGGFAEAINQINANPAYCIAVDIASGQ